MNSNNILKICGSITKTESLVRIKENVLNHTFVAEANLPYSNYYGRIPGKKKPNSLFFFTDKYYSLEESLRFSQSIELCAKNEINVASAVMQFSNNCQPAIRIRNFPDYKNLEKLQQCYIDQGVKFARKVNLEPETLVTVNKCFEIEKVDDNIFLDQDEKNEGYIVISKYLNFSQFKQLIAAVRNNGNCRTFDAAMGGLIIEGKAINIIRIYSGKMDIDLLNCVKNEVDKQIKLI